MGWSLRSQPSPCFTSPLKKLRLEMSSLILLCRRSASSGHGQFGLENLASGFWAEQYRQGDADAADRGSDQHRDRKPQMPGGREVSQYRSHQPSEDRSLVIDETARRRAYFGRESFGEVGR